LRLLYSAWMNSPKGMLALACVAIALVFLCQVAGWDPRNVPCMFRLSPACAASCLNRSPNLRNAHLKVQTIGNIRYVAPGEALVEYLYEADNATPDQEANPNSSQIKLAAFREVFYRWRLEQ